MLKWGFKKLIVSAVILFATFIGIGLALNYINHQNHDSVVEANWRDLGQLNYENGSAPTTLKELDGRMVKVPGFMVPLEDDMRNVTEFLLVPSPQACIHVPPPPPNQMIYVKMKERGTEAAFGPVWVYGILYIKSQHHMYGDASFSLIGVRVEPYR